MFAMACDTHRADLPTRVGVTPGRRPIRHATGGHSPNPHSRGLGPCDRSGRPVHCGGSISLQQQILEPTTASPGLGAVWIAAVPQPLEGGGRCDVNEKTLPDPGTMPADERSQAERLHRIEAAGPASPLSTTPEADKVSDVAGGDRIRCPHCHNPIRLTDGRSDEVLCPACGGTLRVCDT